MTAVAACMGDTIETVTRTYAHVVPNTAGLAVAAMQAALGGDQRANSGRTVG